MSFQITPLLLKERGEPANPVFRGLCLLMSMYRRVSNLRRLTTNPTVNVPVGLRDVSVPLGPTASSACSPYCLCSPPQHHHTCHSGAKWRPHNNIRWPWQYLKSTSSSNLTLMCHRGFIALKVTHPFTFSFISIFLFLSPFWKKAWGGRGWREKSKRMDESLWSNSHSIYPSFEQKKVMNAI